MDRKLIQSKFQTLLILFSMFLASCGGSNGEDSSSEPITLTGTFIDSPVANIYYRTETQSGYTNLNGGFVYILGETIEFSIGKVMLPKTAAKDLITPFDIANTDDPNHPIVINIARLLQSLDEDNDASNGLKISSRSHELAQELPATVSDEDLNARMLEWIKTSNGSPIISPERAISHLLANIKGSDDYDNDSVINQLDNCVTIKNENQRDTDQDGIGDICDLTPAGPDTDSDGRPDILDNCVNESNSDQLDSDEDEIGNACDTTPYGPDSDGDGTPDLIDNCPSIENTTQQDIDQDAVGDLCDSSPIGNDSEAPVATILFPPEFSISKNATVTIRGTANDSTRIEEVSVNGIAATSTDNYANWVVELELEQGLNEVVVETSDTVNIDQRSDTAIVQITGPAITYPGDIAVDKTNNKIYWIDSLGPILSMDLSTKHRSIVEVQPGDIDFSSPRGFALSENGDTAYISDTELDAVITLNLATGQAQLLSNCPSELSFGDEIAMDHDAERILVADSSKDQVVAINMNTGECSVLFSQGSSIGGLAWNEVNKKIYYGSGNLLYSYDEETGSNEVVAEAMQSPLTGHVKHLLFDPERNRIIWRGSNDYYDTDVLYMLNAETSEITEITNNQIANEEAKIGTAHNMVLSADGNQVLLMNITMQALIGIDLDTGEHSILMNNLPSERDQGPNMQYPKSIVTNDGYAYAIDGRSKAIMKINLENGDKEIFLDQVLDFSSLTMRIENIRIDRENNQLYVMVDVDVIPEKLYLNDSLPEFIKVDLTTKEQTIFSTARAIGDEPDLHYASDFELDIKHNRVLALDTSPDEIVEIDISTGERNIFSGRGIPNNTHEFSQVKQAILDTNGNRLFVYGSPLLEVDLKTGNRTVFTTRTEMQGLLAIDNTHQRLFSLIGKVIYEMDLQTKVIKSVSDWTSSDAQNQLSSYKKLTYSEQTNLLYVTDSTSQMIFVIDTVTGSRMILSN